MKLPTQRAGLPGNVVSITGSAGGGASSRLARDDLTTQLRLTRARASLSPFFFPTIVRIHHRGTEGTERGLFCLSRELPGTDKKASVLNQFSWLKAREFMENRYLPRTLRGIFDRFSMRIFLSVYSVSRMSPCLLGANGR